MPWAGPAPALALFHNSVASMSGLWVPECPPLPAPGWGAGKRNIVCFLPPLPSHRSARGAPGSCDTSTGPGWAGGAGLGVPAGPCKRKHSLGLHSTQGLWPSPNLTLPKASSPGATSYAGSLFSQRGDLDCPSPSPCLHVPICRMGTLE